MYLSMGTLLHKATQVEIENPTKKKKNRGASTEKKIQQNKMVVKAKRTCNLYLILLNLQPLIKLCAGPEYGEIF